MSETHSKVLVIHGYGNTWLTMEPLRFRLSRQGFDAEHWCYRSLWQSTSSHAKRLKDYLGQLDDSDTEFNIVAHSMGSLITRAALAETIPKGLRRIVFITPPLHGTPIAKLAPAIVKRISRPLGDLSTDASSLTNSLPDLKEIDVGIIAARIDLLVPKSSSQMPTAQDRIVVNATHNSILFSRRAAMLAGTFLKTGSFHG